MNYKLIYDAIINNAKSFNRKRSKTFYFEKHHIIPTCIGGDDKETNKVLLTAKEHFVCHHLLTKLHPNDKSLHSAFWLMCIYTSANQQRVKATSLTFAIAKQKISEIARERRIEFNKNNPRSGSKNGMFGTHRNGRENPFYGKTHSDKTKQMISETKSKNPTIWTEDQKEKLKRSWDNRPIISCIHCGKQSIHVGNMKRYHFENCKIKQKEQAS
jgi:hypothetical protein